MSLKKNEDGMGWIVICDCGEELEILDAKTRADAARYMHQDKWRFVKVGRQIKHRCPACILGNELDKSVVNK